MRTETEVESCDVLAMWLKEGEHYITESPSVFTTAVRKSGYRRNQGFFNP